MKKLKKVYIEITNKCNLSCAFCPGTSRKPEFMSVEAFGTVLAKLSGVTDYLYLHVMGEPLLHPELAELLKLCGEYGYKVNITTNGVLVGKSTEVLLGSRALRQVNFSLHSREELPGREGLETYLNDIFEFSSLALEKRDIFISFRLWNLTSGAADEYNALVAQKLERFFTPEFSILEAMGQTNRIRIRERLFLNLAEVFEWPSLTARESGDTGFCLGLRDQAAVLVDGTVVPCCLDSGGVVRLGNLFYENMADILESERAQAIYEGFSERRAVEELCRKCGYRARFSNTKGL